MLDDEKILTKKEGEPTPWAEDALFYMLTADGLFVCRNHPYFTSCVPAGYGFGPVQLASHTPNLVNRYPRVPQTLIEQAAGFFSWANDAEIGEVALCILHNPETNDMSLVAPKQECSWGSVNYELPTQIPAGYRIIGDIHSHV